MTAVLVMTGLLACGNGEVEQPRDERIGWSDAATPEGSPGAANSAPLIHEVSLVPDEPASGERVRAVVSATDPDGDPLELSFVWEIGGDVQSSGTPEITLGELAPGETIAVRAVASDGSLSSEPVEAEVRVRNRRPVVTRLVVTPGGAVSRGMLVTAMAEGSDPDGSPLDFAYTWLVNDEARSDGPTLDTGSLRVGDAIRVRVLANDGQDESDEIDSAPIRIVNAPPVISSMPSAGLQNGVFRYVIEASDPDGDRTLRYYLKSGPDGMTINSVVGQVTWQPRPDQAGSHPVQVVVEDAAGGRTVQDFVLDIRTDAPAAPAAPASASR